jgi:serine/threonine protein kinase
LSIEDKSLLDEAVEEEWSTPGPYKIRGDYTIHVSTQSDLLDEAGLPIISDFGEAHLGEPPFCEEVMPDLYRAPEIILGIAWDNKIDIWSFGLMVQMPQQSMRHIPLC